MGSVPAYGYPPPKAKDRSWVWIVSAVALSLFILMGSCYYKLGREGAESDVAVAEFHKQMNAGECDAIYRDATPEFEKAVTMDQWRTMCEGIPKKLGAHQRSSRQQVGFNTTINGSFVNANYSSEFALGPGQERFSWKKDGKRLRLVGYFVNSPKLLTFDK